MKRTRLRKASRSKIPSLKRKLWKVFADYVKLRDNYTCFTCGKKVSGQNCQAGHYIPKSVGGFLLYYHEDNVHVQCGYCNLALQGNQHVYGEKLGPEKVLELRLLLGKTYKYSAQDIIDLTKKYEDLYASLSSDKHSYHNTSK